MEIKKIQPSQSNREAMLSSGFDLLLKHGYENVDLKMLAEELGISWEDVSAAYSSKEDYYLDALQRLLMRFSYDIQYKLSHASLSSYSKAFAVYRMDLMKLQTESFISSIYAFYARAEIDQLRRFWKIIEDYARGTLEQFEKTLSPQNIKTLIYCLSMIFSKNALVMHDAPSDIVCGCGNDESDILFRGIKAMRDKSKTKNNNEERELISHT